MAVVRSYQHLQKRSLPENGVTVVIEKNRLTQAGYDYAAVQAKVNELMK